MSIRSSIRLVSPESRFGFTLVELLVSILVLSISASLVLFAMTGAMEVAKRARTKATIAKIDRIISDLWDDYQSRRVPIRIPPGTAPPDAARMRLNAIRELMRLELPDRITDVRDDPYPPSKEPLVQMARTAVSHGFLRALPTGWNLNNPNAQERDKALRFQGAECLYMILSKTKDGNRSAIANFSEDSIGDVDDDDMPEILDAWGNPIEFIRWPAGRRAYPGIDGEWGEDGVDDDNDGIVDNATEALWPNTDDVRPIPTKQDVGAEDPYDFRKVDPRWQDADLTNDPFALYPLIYSAGADREYNIASDGDPQIRYSASSPADPYQIVPILNYSIQLGAVQDPSSDGHLDNIDNHFLGTR